MLHRRGAPAPAARHAQRARAALHHRSLALACGSTQQRDCDHLRLELETVTGAGISPSLACDAQVPYLYVTDRPVGRLMADRLIG